MTATHPLAAAVLQQEAGEPVAWQARCKMHPKWRELPAREVAEYQEHGWEIRALYAQVSPPQAQVPLTEDQIDVLLHTKHFDKSYKLHASDKVCIDWYRLGLRDGERAHLIGLETKE